jgi:hypothetical protein
MTGNGFWSLSVNGKKNVQIEKKDLPSKWITLKAMKVLKFYRDSV